LTLWFALLLGIVQGLTEFLPVSSSGHLFLLWKVFEQNQEGFLPYTVCVHLATLLAVLTFLSSEILAILKEKKISLVCAVIVATVPAGVVGLLLKDYMDSLPAYVVAFGFVTSGLLCLGCKEQGKAEYDKIGILKALFVGAFQAVAVLPGVSRSGSTLFASLKSRLSRKDAAIFSFLLSLPVIAGAGLLDAKDLLKTAQFETLPLIVSTVAAYFSALFGLKLLVRFLIKGRLVFFSFYLFGLALFTLLYCHL